MQVGSPRVHGYGLVAVLALLALTSFGLAAAGEVWLQTSKRDEEQELLRIGHLYAQALKRYRDTSPGSVKKLPKELDELLLDRRFVGMVRHLRRLYPDPKGADGRWVVLRDEEGLIKGVYSSSQEEPIAAGGVRRFGLELPPASRYSDWKFLADHKS